MTPDRKKRLFLDSTVFDLQADGGISRYWYELVSNLARRHGEWELTLFAHSGTSNKFGRELIEVTRDKPNVSLHDYLPRQAGRFFGPMLSNQFKGYVWHSSYYRVPTRLKMPQVCTVYDFIFERYFSGPRAWLHKRKKRRAILGAQRIICPSLATKRELLSLFPHIDEAMVHVIYLGLSDAFRLPPEGPPALPAKKPNVLYVGSRADYKNFALTVRSVALVAGLELYIIGGKQMSPSELELLQTHLPNRYRNLGSPPDDVLRELYRGAVALAYLSRCEGFGFPPLEAMGCGCPVIAMDSTSIPEVVGDAGILISHEDPQRIAEDLRSMQVPERRQSFREKGIKRAQLFSWDAAVDQTVEVYDRIVY